MLSMHHTCDTRALVVREVDTHWAKDTKKDKKMGKRHLLLCLADFLSVG